MEDQKIFLESIWRQVKEIECKKNNWMENECGKHGIRGRVIDEMNIMYTNIYLSIYRPVCYPLQKQ